MFDLIRIGARKSILAKIQAYHVGGEIQNKIPKITVTYHFQESMGDKDLTSPLWKMTEKGVFTRDLQEELVCGRIDCIIHSWKDLDLEERPETNVYSVLSREDQRDVLFFKKSSWFRIPTDLLFNTSSPRREYNLGGFFSSYLPKRFQNKTMRFEPIRGNIQTRIRKFLDGSADGLIIAKAALDRIMSSETLKDIPIDDLKEVQEVSQFVRSSLQHCLLMVLPLSENPNAPAQGALAMEVSKSDTKINELAKSLSHPATERSAILERKTLSQFGGGCHQKIGVAVTERHYGTVMYLRGFTDQGQILKEAEILHENLPQFSKSEVWPIDAKMGERGRKHLPVSIPKDKDIFVARSYALPPEASLDPETQILWTAGMNTWKDLAQRDLWVHGSFDGLGEESLLDVESIFQKKIECIKLSHNKSPEEKSAFPILATYEVEDPSFPSDFDPKAIKAVFWRSGSEFDAVTKVHPELKDAIPFSGPGSTYRHLKENLPDHSKKQLKAFLSFNNWVNKCTK